jgi:cold shock CspA family protein
MRYQGRITDWKDDRGFGFIAPNGGGPKVFIHIRAFRGGELRPQGGELVTYELVADAKRGPRAQNVSYVGARTASTTTKSSLPRSLVVLALCAGGIGVYGWQRYQAAPPPEVPITPSTAALQIQGAARYACRGKQHCSQMTSCEEATFYLKNCPDVKIDGDGDGVPCEEQWCGGR